MSYCELQQEITNPSLAFHLWQSLFPVLTQAVQGGPLQLVGSLPMCHSEAYIDTCSLSLDCTANKISRHLQ